MNRVYNQSLLNSFKRININRFIHNNNSNNNIINNRFINNNNISISINSKVNNSNNNNNNKYYTTISSPSTTNTTTTTTTTNSINPSDGKKLIGIDFKNANNILISNEKEIIEKSELPQELISIQNKILECNEDEITIIDRISSARLLYQFIGAINKTPHTFNKSHLDKIWKLLNIKKELIQDKSYYIEILNDQLGIAVSSRYLLPRVFSTIQNVIEKVQQLEDSGRFNNNKELLYQKLSALTSLAYMASANLGMWKEMIQLRSKMDSNRIERLKSLKEVDREHDYESIYKLISNNIPYSSFIKPIFDINNSKPINNDKDFNSFRIYDCKSFGFKNLQMKTIDMDKLKSDSAINEFNSNLKNMENHAKDINGYFISQIQDSSILILGRSIKLNILFDTDFEMIHGGVLDENFSECQLYGSYIDLNGTLVESQYNLIIDFPVIDEKQSFAQLKGTHRKVETTTKNEKTIYDMDVTMNIERRQLKFELSDNQQQQQQQK